MSVRSAHPPVGLGRVVFDSYQNPFDFSTTPDILTHATTLHIIVSSRIRDRSYALTTISSCPNLRTLEVGRAPGGRKEQVFPSPPWPATLHLHHLRRLRIDPRLSAPFTVLLLSNCLNVEHLVIDSSTGVCHLLRSAVRLRPEYELHQFPHLRTLDTLGDRDALQ